MEQFVNERERVSAKGWRSKNRGLIEFAALPEFRSMEFGISRHRIRKRGERLGSYPLMALAEEFDSIRWG